MSSPVSHSPRAPPQTALPILVSILVFLLSMSPATVHAQSPVDQPITLSAENSAVTSFEVLDCHAAPTAITGNGKMSIVQIDPSCQFLIATTNPGTYFLNYQNANNEIIETSCQTGTCPPISLQYYTETNAPGSVKVPVQPIIPSAPISSQSTSVPVSASSPTLLSAADFELLAIFGIILILTVAFLILSRGGSE